MSQRRASDQESKEQREAEERAGKDRDPKPTRSPGARDAKQTRTDKPDPEDPGLTRGRGVEGEAYGRQTHGGQAYGRDGTSGQDIRKPIDEPLRAEDEVRDPTKRLDKERRTGEDGEE